MIELKSMAVAMPEVVGHPNRRAFRGVLTTVDMVSERAPSGARGHRVVLTRMAAEAALPSLLGMALDYSPSLDRHDVRRKVGVITSAEIVGRNVELGGYLFARDFPEIVEEIAKSGRESGRRLTERSNESGGVVRNGMQVMASNSRGKEVAKGLKNSLIAAAERMFSLAEFMNKGLRARVHGVTIRAETCVAVDCSGLGLSYEVTAVQVADTREHVWKLLKVMFTGAAILRKNKAAYQDTWIELSS